MEKTNISKENIYKLQGRVPLSTAIPLGMQHILAMYAGNLAPLLVISSIIKMENGLTVSLLQNAMFVAGIVTLIQLRPILKIGSGLPTVMGTSSSFINVGIVTASTMGYSYVIGACLLGGILEFLLGFIIKPLRKILPHVVTGTVVTALGISLIAVGIQFIAGGVGSFDDPEFGSLRNLGVGLFVFLLIIFLQRSTNKTLKVSSILLGMVIGYVLAVAIGMVDFSPVINADWIGFPKPIFLLDGIDYKFDLNAIIPFLLVYLATTVETIGDNTGIAMGGLGRDITDEELRGAVHADGFGSVFATLFGVLPNTSFSQNVGLIGLTKVVNRFTIGTGAIFLILCSFFPKLGALVSTIPNPVLGGGVLLMFAMITMSGLNLLFDKGHITERETIIVAASLAIAFGLSGVPKVMQQLPNSFTNMFSQAIVGAFVTSTILNLILPRNKDN